MTTYMVSLSRNVAAIYDGIPHPQAIRAAARRFAPDTLVIEQSAGTRRYGYDLLNSSARVPLDSDVIDLIDSAQTRGLAWSRYGATQYRLIRHDTLLQT